MDLDLRKFNDTQLEKILDFTKKLATEIQQDDLANFGDPNDLAQAEQTAKDYIKRRKAGYRTVGIKEDAEIRKSVRDFLRRKGVFKKAEAESDTRELSIIRPTY